LRQTGGLLQWGVENPIKRAMLKLLSCLLIAAIPFTANALPSSSAVPGGVLVLPLTSAKTTAPHVSFRGKRALVVRDNGKWVALVGLPLSLTPGQYDLSVNNAMKKFRVVSKKYPEQRITIKDTRKVEPNPDDMQRINSEQPKIDIAKNIFRDTQEVDLKLQLPADGPLSSRFGLRRIFNGQPRNPHAGLDIAIPTGTRVMSAANGKVIDTGDYFFNGNTVFVDHGQGLITMYCHLSEINVNIGDVVTKGQPLALSGMTGRVSGPHLHWSVIMNGTMIDPEIFVKAREE
jgi:murein DD-endopeptidase MepM/ murein hydrolase activator NlpD